VKRKRRAAHRRPSPLVKRSMYVADRKTSFTLEDAFWKALKDIAGSKNTSLHDIVTMIDKTRSNTNLSSAVRLFVLDYYRGLANKRTARRRRSAT
jgi:predicted DNA-binding ribbon-helix-helix protein